MRNTVERGSVRNRWPNNDQGLPVQARRVGQSQRTARGTRQFAELIASETRDGAELVEYAPSVLRSEATGAANKQWAVEYLTERMLGRTPQAGELPAEEHEDKALPFFHPLSPEQRAFAEHMVKTLPED